MNGSTPYEGRLEVRRGDGGAWGTIRGCHWTGHEARIACQALGFPGHLSPYRCSEKFGRGPGPVHIVLDTCYEESTLAGCIDASQSSEWDEENSMDDHRCDVGLICLSGKFSFSSIYFKISLVRDRNRRGISPFICKCRY